MTPLRRRHKTVTKSTVLKAFLIQRTVILLQVFDHGLGAGMDVKFIVDAAQMAAHGIETHRQRIGDFFITVAFGEKLQDFLLAFGKIFQFRCLAFYVAKMFHHHARDAPRHGRSAAVDFLDGFQNFGCGRAFDQITAGTGHDGIEHQVAVFIHGEHQDLHLRQQRFEFAGAFNARHLRKVDVHQHHVWRLVENLFERFFGRVIRADTLGGLAAIDQKSHTITDLLVIFYDGYFYVHSSA
jgi:hypothetical protein